MAIDKVRMTNLEALNALYKSSRHCKETVEAYHIIFDALTIIENSEEIEPCTEEYRRVYMQGWNDGRRKLVDAMVREIAN